MLETKGGRSSVPDCVREVVVVVVASKEHFMSHHQVAPLNGRET